LLGFIVIQKNSEKYPLEIQTLRSKACSVDAVVIIFNQKQMEIKRQFELRVTTERRFIIRQSAPEKQISCTRCGEPMLTTGQAAEMCGISERRIFRIIEAEAVHYSEAGARAVMICITSLAEILGDETQENHGGSTDYPRTSCEFNTLPNSTE
jgi:hypothetical protein